MVVREVTPEAQEIIIPDLFRDCMGETPLLGAQENTITAADKDPPTSKNSRATVLPTIG